MVSNIILLIIILILACILSFIAGGFVMWMWYLNDLKKNYTPKRHYSYYEFDPFDDYSCEPNDQNIKIFSVNGRKQEQEMISNLVTNMIEKNAPLSEIDRAIKYSMVIIECKKHKLNWEKAYKDFNIEELKKKYLI